VTKRVIVVDDHRPWRRNVRGLLDFAPGWEIVADTDNGADAIRLAVATAPDLVLLDVDLPRTTGLEAARRILAQAPATRILFVSGHRSWDIIEAAFDAGGRGYVFKMHAGGELLPAMNAVLEGRRFISARLLGRAGEDHASRGDRERCHRHDLGLYSHPTLMLEDFADFAGDALQAGHAVVAVTLAERREELHRRLRARVDVDRAEKGGQYRWTDATAFVDSMLLDGRVDEARFWRVATAVIMQAARRSRRDPPRLSACGEGVGVLFGRGRPDLSVGLERLWDELSAAFNVDTHCGYLVPSSHHRPSARPLDDIRAVHTSIITR
jgi:DNA-binding NarL/FixJ family response regulator